VKLWFTDTGGTGTPIVLLHANTGTSASWEPQATAFAREGYRVIAFDRRGWGKSLADPATGQQPGSVAADLDALANEWNCRNRALYFGWRSGGGTNDGRGCALS
jgi:pimeloyl-ACP methyl ester carboxylesterase